MANHYTESSSMIECNNVATVERALRIIEIVDEMLREEVANESFSYLKEADNASQVAAFLANPEVAEWLKDSDEASAHPEDHPLIAEIMLACVEEGRDWGLGFNRESDGTGIWIVHDETIDINAIAHVFEVLVPALDLPPVAIQYSYGCSKPRLDEFGGGALFISKELGSDWMSSSQWLYQQRQKHDAKVAEMAGEAGGKAA